MMTEQRQREVEELAQGMLLQSASITPDGLAERAGINWFLARYILRGLANKGLLKGLPSGHFSR